MLVFCMSFPVPFVYLKAIDKTILQDIRYITSNNFTGQPIPGYEAPKCILTREAATALASVQKHLRKDGLSLKVYDGYRPQRAVDFFVEWSQSVDNQITKQSYYPRIDKKDFFKLNYVQKMSSHSRGSTVDLTIVKIFSNGAAEELNMGTPFDYMDELSHPLNKQVDKIAQNNRLFLRRIMESAGFKPIDTEWWHFTLKNEPYPETYFDFPVK